MMVVALVEDLMASCLDILEVGKTYCCSFGGSDEVLMNRNFMLVVSAFCTSCYCGFWMYGGCV